MALYLGTNRVKIRTSPYVRYTVVGSPTLINGVLSGTSAGNYIRTDTKWSVGQNFEIVMRAKPLQANGQDGLMCIHLGTAACLKLWFSTTKIRLMPNTSSAEILTINGTFSNSTFYYVKATKNGATGTLSYSTDGTTWTGTVSSDTLTWGAKLDYVDFGIIPNWPVYFGGEIDLNNSYIKENGQYWWNGAIQYAQTYTLHQGE